MTPAWKISSYHLVDGLLMGKDWKAKKKKSKDRHVSICLAFNLSLAKCRGWTKWPLWLLPVLPLNNCTILLWRKREKSRVGVIIYVYTHTHTEYLFMHKHYSYLLFSQLLNFNFYPLCVDDSLTLLLSALLLSSYGFHQSRAIDCKTFPTFALFVILFFFHCSN